VSIWCEEIKLTSWGLLKLLQCCVVMQRLSIGTHNLWQTSKQSFRVPLTRKVGQNQGKSGKRRNFVGGIGKITYRVSQTILFPEVSEIFS